MNDKQHAARRLVEDHTTARRLVEDHTAADNPIDWQTLIESALLLALVGMVLWTLGGGV